jgi:branched-chain amino acid transport system ATP-binding protein
MPALLEGYGLTVRFGGLTALRGVAFALSPGEVLSVIGPNGAGKTTLFNVVAGSIRPTAGRVVLRGRSLDRLPSHQIARLGVVRTFQKTEIFWPLSLLQGVQAGSLARRECSTVDALFGRGNREIVVDRAREALRTVGLLSKMDVPAEQLSYGEQRLLELAQALAADPEVLLLDEPASGMNREESAHIMRVIGELRARGLAIILVEHNMHVVMTMSDRVIVLNHGEKIAEGTADQVRMNSRVIEAYLGVARPG